MNKRGFPEQLELNLGLDELAADIGAPGQQDALVKAVAQRLGVPVFDLPPVSVRKRAVDARRGRVQFHLTISVGVLEDHELGAPLPLECQGQPQVVIVGDGPAGLFCAYQLARQGIGAVVLDRGKPVQPRRRDLKLLNARGGVDADSNYCFGEGGAGTYSDGKLYTRSHKRGPVRDVMELLALHGAPAQILTEARPHIGSNLLPKVITAMRERLENCGVQFRFGARVTALLTAGRHGDRKAVGVSYVDVETGGVHEIGAQAVVLATGHSARDVFAMAHDAGVSLEAKGFALGVRIEHPQEMINRIQYGKFAEHPKLGAAPYKIATQVDGRGVYSFCMCPGGWIVPAMTDAEHLVINGMSLSKRDSAFANSGFVVGIEPQDYQALGFDGPLGGVRFQAQIERVAQVAGGGQNRAPAARVSDFIAGRVSQSLPDSSYLPGLTPGDVSSVVDSAGLPMSARMKAALQHFGRRMRGFDSSEGIVVGVETRTSSPVRLVRDPHTCSAQGLASLYLAGEGAGYAGGIVSAAVDGMVVAEQIASTLRT